MDNRPIGIFDSGLGGLTCLPYLRRRLPLEKVVYFGDTARAPYGSKSPQTIRVFARQIADFLVQHDVKMIVIACNSATAVALDDLTARCPDIPVLGIIAPAAEEAARLCEKGPLGVIGTRATVESHEYTRQIGLLKPSLQVRELACPAFAPLIEEGVLAEEVMDPVVRYYLDDFVAENEPEALLLGCTHYPLLISHIRRCYPDLPILDPSEIIVSRIEEALRAREALAADRGDAENRLYASMLSETFLHMVENVFGEKAELVAQKSLDIDGNAAR